MTTTQVIGAAHCMYNDQGRRNENELLIVVGEIDQGVDDGQIDFNVFKAIIHSAYDPGGVFHNDIVVYVLDREMAFSYSVLPACLPKGKELHTGIEMEISGWGLTEHGPTSRYLKYGKVNVVELNKCYELSGRGKMESIFFFI